MKSWSILMMSGLVVLVGCDLGTYSSRYNDRIGKMTSMANSNEALANELIEVAGVAKIRVPKVCNNEDSVRYNAQADFLRARIPGIELDGFQMSLMGDKESADGSWYPFQVYLYYVQGKNTEDVKRDVKAAVAKVLAQTAVKWDSLPIESYDGTQYSWEQSTIGATMPFMVYADGSERKTDLNGRLDFFLTGNDSGVLIVAMRAPSSVFSEGDRPLVDGTLKSIQGFK